MHLPVIGRFFNLLIMETLTHWKKNNDPKYISGEDLKDGIAINKGLQPEMVVTIVGFEDKETYDQNNQTKVLKTGLFLKDENGKQVYKPLILNNTNAKFLINESKSEFMEHWIGIKAVLFAMPDKRFGHVARFKKYTQPVQVDETAAKVKLSKATTLPELQTSWTSLSAAEQANPAVIAEKERLKGILK